MISSGVNTRELILEILLQIEEEGEHSHIAIRNALSKYQFLPKQERSFITRVCEGTLEYRIYIDYVIDSFSKVSVNKMKPQIREILRSAVYQLKFMDSVPDSAVCNEAVKLATKRGFTGLKGFVNGVLRNIARNKDNITYPDRNKDIEQYLSVKYSMPLWIVKMWHSQLGIDKTEKILAGFKQEKKTYVRCNTAKAPVEEIKRILSQENVSVADVEGIPYALEIKDYDYIAGLNSFRDGLYQIQDISSMTAGYMTGFKAGDTVIDVCAAPGGKSVNAAISVGTDGKVYSRDVSDYKAGLIEENISRLGLNNIEVQVKDALVMDESMREKADVVIADLPCSGLGVMGRKPDIRYNITEDKLVSLKELQQSILSVVQAYVKQGGIMMYSTCTINSEENEANADWLCKEYGFKKIEYRQILPGKNGGTDGFFVAKLRRE
mgnify:CR=1 FL=1